MERPTGAELRIRRQANKTLEQPKIIDIIPVKISRGDAEMRRMFAKRAELRIRCQANRNV